MCSAKSDVRSVAEKLLRTFIEGEVTTAEVRVDGKSKDCGDGNAEDVASIPHLIYLHPPKLRHQPLYPTILNH